MKTYITLLSTRSYLPGVLALNESLKRVGGRYPLLVALSANMGDSSIEPTLRKAGMITKILPDSLKIPVELKMSSGHWGHTFDKIHLFGLTEYSKLVYVDSDMIVLKNIDELFEKPHMSAVSAGCLVHTDWKRLNSGLMVIEPEAALPENIVSTLPKALAVASSTGMTAIGDQDLINAYYETWPSCPELHLFQGYNIFQSHLDAYIEAQGYHLASNSQDNEKTVKIVHFIGARKPWMKGAKFRNFMNVIKKRGAVKWENKVFSMYKKLINDSVALHG